MKTNEWMTIGLIGLAMGLVLAPGTSVLAAEGDEVPAAESHAPTPAELDALVNDPDLPAEEKTALEAAVREYREGGELRLRETEWVEKPTLLGAPDSVTGGLTGTTGDRPYLGGGGEFPQKDLTVEEKALMDKVDSRAHELESQGLSEKEIHEMVEREMGSEMREAAEKHGIDYEKEMEHREMEYAPRETEFAPREVESHPVESTREPMETERPTTGYEHPEVERPPQEYTPPQS